MAAVALYVSVPVACFRAPRAREYFETLPCPPPATAYGMLLSLVGETDRRAHEGAEVALAMLSDPPISVVLRTLWRVKSRKHGLGLAENRRPDFQEILTDVRLVVWVRAGQQERADPSLADRVKAGIDHPAQIARFGGLSLGESTHLVNEARLYRAEDGFDARLLVRDKAGDLSLPVWVDHVGSAGTRWGQYSLQPTLVESRPLEQAWSRIMRPG